MRRSALLSAFLASVAAVAAPVPPQPEKERIAAIWGKTKGVGEFSLTREQLTIRTKGEPVYSSKLPELRTMPHTLRTVTGNFEVTVRILQSDAPDPKAKVDPGTGGTYLSFTGLFVEGGDYNLSVALMQSYHTQKGIVDKEPTRRIRADAGFTDGSIVCFLKPIEEGKSPEFRITRNGNKVSTSYRFGAGQWSEPHTPRVKQDFPNEVTIGVYLFHSTYQIMQATFDKLTVEKLAVPAGGKQ